MRRRMRAEAVPMAVAVMVGVVGHAVARAQAHDDVLQKPSTQKTLYST